MKCDVCARELKEDSQFCDICGNKVLSHVLNESETRVFKSNDNNNFDEEIPESQSESGIKENHQDVKMGFNTQALIMGILISVLLTLIITGSARAFGLPLLFGGLFLPFFWYKKNRG